jgi:hypothetical protein
VCPCGQNVPAWVPRDTNHRRNRVRPPGTAFSVCRHAHGAAAALISCRDTQGGVVWCGKQFQLVWWVTANRVLQKQARPPTDCDYPTNPERPPQIAHRFPQNTGTSLACTHRIRSPALSARCPHLHRRYKFPGTLLAVVPNRYKQTILFFSLCNIIGSDGPERVDAVPKLPSAPRPGAAKGGGKPSRWWRRPVQRG